jgi:hypothetical protein
MENKVKQRIRQFDAALALYLLKTTNIESRWVDTVRHVRERDGKYRRYWRKYARESMEETVGFYARFISCEIKDENMKNLIKAAVEVADYKEVTQFVLQFKQYQVDGESKDAPTGYVLKSTRGLRGLGEFVGVEITSLPKQYREEQTAWGAFWGRITEKGEVEKHERMQRGDKLFFYFLDDEEDYYEEDYEVDALLRVIRLLEAEELIRIERIVWIPEEFSLGVDDLDFTEVQVVGRVS